ncbi:MAG: hypothetical protein V1827_05875 [Candidatus Micrarchaeota archaeon]
MTDLRRTIKCSNCGSESGISLSSEVDIRELHFTGRCRCGSSLQISYSIVGEGLSQPSIPKSDAPSESPIVNIDESLFTPDIPSDTLKDLMDD